MALLSELGFSEPLRRVLRGKTEEQLCCVLAIHKSHLVESVLVDDGFIVAEELVGAETVGADVRVSAELVLLHCDGHQLQAVVYGKDLQRMETPEFNGLLA